MRTSHQVPQGQAGPPAIGPEISKNRMASITPFLYIWVYPEDPEDLVKKALKQSDFQRKELYGQLKRTTIRKSWVEED